MTPAEFVLMNILCDEKSSVLWRPTLKRKLREFLHRARGGARRRGGSNDVDDNLMQDSSSSGGNTLVMSPAMKDAIRLVGRLLDGHHETNKKSKRALHTQSSPTTMSPPQPQSQSPPPTPPPPPPPADFEEKSPAMKDAIRLVGHLLSPELTAAPAPLPTLPQPSPPPSSSPPPQPSSPPPPSEPLSPAMRKAIKLVGHLLDTTTITTNTSTVTTPTRTTSPPAASPPPQPLPLPAAPTSHNMNRDAIIEQLMRSLGARRETPDDDEKGVSSRKKSAKSHRKKRPASASASASKPTTVTTTIPEFEDATIAVAQRKVHSEIDFLAAKGVDAIVAESNGWPLGSTPENLKAQFSNFDAKITKLDDKIRKLNIETLEKHNDDVDSIDNYDDEDEDEVVTAPDTPRSVTSDATSFADASTNTVEPDVASIDQLLTTDECCMELVKGNVILCTETGWRSFDFITEEYGEFHETPGSVATASSSSTSVATEQLSEQMINAKRRRSTSSANGVLFHTTSGDIEFAATLPDAPLTSDSEPGVEESVTIAATITSHEHESVPQGGEVGDNTADDGEEEVPPEEKIDAKAARQAVLKGGACLKFSRKSPTSYPTKVRLKMKRKGHIMWHHGARWAALRSLSGCRVRRILDQFPPWLGKKELESNPWLVETPWRSRKAVLEHSIVVEVDDKSQSEIVFFFEDLHDARMWRVGIAALCGLTRPRVSTMAAKAPPAPKVPTPAPPTAPPPAPAPSPPPPPSSTPPSSSLPESHVAGQSHVIATKKPSQPVPLIYRTLDSDDLVATSPAPKSEKTRAWLIETLSRFFGLQQLPLNTLSRCADQMKGIVACAGWDIICQAECVHNLYILQSGTCDVLVDGEVIGKLPDLGVIFGELAILQTLASTVTVRVASHAAIWALDVSALFQAAHETRGGIEIYRLMREIRLFRGVDHSVLRAIASDASLKAYHSASEIVLDKGIWLLKAGGVLIQSGKMGRKSTTHGDVFNELSGISSKPTSERFYAAHDIPQTVVVYLPFDSLRRHLGLDLDERLLHSFKLGVLHRVPIVRGLDPRLLERLASCFREETYGEGAVIAQAGKSWSNLTVVLDGTISFQRHGVEVKRLGSITHFGEELLTHKRRLKSTLVASARGSENVARVVRLLHLSRDDFQPILGQPVHEIVERKNIESVLKAATFRDFPGVHVFSFPWIGLDLLVQSLFVEEGWITMHDVGEVIGSRAGEDDATACMHVVINGTVSVREQGGGIDCTLEPSSYFGEDALIDDAYATSSRRVLAKAVTPCTVVSLSRRRVELYCGALRPQLVAAWQRRENSAHIRALSDSGTLSENLVGGGSVESGTFGQLWILHDKTTLTALVRMTLSKRQIYADGKLAVVRAAVELARMQIDHASFVSIVHTSFSELGIQIYMEHVPGGDMRVLLDSHGPFDERTSAFFALQVAGAMHYLHESGVVYRTLRPSCILVDERGYIKIQLDFLLGGCKLLADGEVAYTLCGLCEYMSPEMVSLSGHAHKTDVWSFGVLCHELMTNTTPFAPSATFGSETYIGILSKEVEYKSKEIPGDTARAFLAHLLAKQAASRPRFSDLRVDAWLASQFTISEMLKIERRSFEMNLSGVSGVAFGVPAAAPAAVDDGGAGESHEVTYEDDGSDFDSFFQDLW
ncbi:serine/threonine-protein kinase RUNKEL [Pycnococcus provasolii]